MEAYPECPECGASSNSPESSLGNHKADLESYLFPAPPPTLFFVKSSNFKLLVQFISDVTFHHFLIFHDTAILQNVSKCFRNI